MALSDERDIEPNRIGIRQIVQSACINRLARFRSQRIDLLNVEKSKFDARHRADLWAGGKQIECFRAKQKEPVKAGSFWSGITCWTRALARDLQSNALRRVTTHGHHLLHPVRCCWPTIEPRDSISINPISQTEIRQRPFVLACPVAQAQSIAASRSLSRPGSLAPNEQAG